MHLPCNTFGNHGCVLTAAQMSIPRCVLVPRSVIFLRLINDSEDNDYADLIFFGMIDSGQDVNRGILGEYELTI